MPCECVHCMRQYTQYALSKINTHQLERIYCFVGIKTNLTEHVKHEGKHNVRIECTSGVNVATPSKV